VEEVAEVLEALHRAGWSIGETAFAAVDGSRVWVVSGHNGENQIRAEGASALEAWQEAARQAREVGMVIGCARILWACAHQ
jgi:hypothetical protein